MILLTYLNKLVKSLQDENIPEEGKLALALFIFSVILFISFSNIMLYFIVSLKFEHKIVPN
jgi:F0F1-type ATP synthase membrane subunit a